MKMILPKRIGLACLGFIGICSQAAAASDLSRGVEIEKGSLAAAQP
ncbi:MAG: hypothetical protein IBX58_18070 [Roseovarius sp.]|nr:hypothetical protein [Roseovarius sp.]